MNKLIMQKLIACITLSAFLIQGPGIAGQLSTQYALRPMAAAIDARLGAENALSQTDYTLLAGTRYVRVIRDRSDLYSNNAISIAIIDWDETISLIKKGWQAAMATFVAKIWASGNTQEPGYAWGSGIKPTQDDYEYAHEFVKRTIGTLTRVQYATVIYLKKYRLKNGGIDREAFERALDGILNMSQDDFILPPGSSHPLWGSSGGELWEKAGACYASWKRIMGSEFRDARLKQIRDNISQPDEFLVPYAIDLIRGLHDRGVKLYALSGSGEDQVREEAELLGVKDYFEIIFGYAGTMEEQTGKAYSKSEATKYVLYQLEGIPLGEEHKALLIGDGPSEMDTGRSLGCTTLGLVPGHVSEPDKRNQLFATLKKAGGDYIIVADEGKDFSDWHVLVDFFCSWKASSAGTLPDSIKHLAETGHTPTSLDISTYKKSPYYTLPDGWELEVYPDIDDTGTVFAVKMIRAIQHWQYDMEFLKKHQKVIMQTCTGDTPWLGYKKFIDLYRTWETRDTQAILRRLGINPDLKPDMSMIDMVALDAIFPQKRDAYHAFANILTGFYDPLGIPDENRHFFYGDLIFDNEAGVSRRMTEEEYNNLLSEIDDKGFRLDEFLIGYQRWRAPDMQMFANKYPLQFLHFQALLFHAREMSNFLQGNGGAHIYLYGLGPSDFAEGHIGFNEAHTPINSNAFIASIVYHIASAHAKELGRGGMGDLVDKVRMSEQRFKEFVYKYGRITFSYNDFVKRDDAVNIIISTNNSKSSSNARGVEGPREPDEKFPISVVIRSTKTSRDTRRPKNSLVIDEHSALDLRITRSPYEFYEFSEWSEDMIIEFFVKLSKLVKKPIARLKQEDFLNLGLDELGGGTQDIDWQGIKMRNLKALLTGQDNWEELKQRVIQGLAGRIHTSKGAADSLISGLVSAERLKMLWVNPHADDEYLGTMGVLIRELIDAGVEMATYYTSEGYTSVGDGYVINMLRYISQNYDDAAIARILDAIQASGNIQKQLYENAEKDLCEELIQYLRRSNQHVGSYDWQPWNRMKDKERELRSKLVLLRLLRLYGGAIGSSRDLKEAITHIIDTTLNKEEWANADLDEIKDIKLGIRTIEAKTALMHLGARYENVHEPLESSWYGLEGRETGRSSDKDRIKRVILDEKPTLLGGNGERFGDMAAHSLTENLLAAGLIELEAEGLIDLKSIRMLLYAGVWHRISQDEEGCRLSMVLSEQEMETGAGTFEGFYPSQHLPGVPYSGFREPMGFGRMVIGNAVRGRDELHTLGIAPANIAAATKLAQEESGVLNYKVLEFKDDKSRNFLRSKMRAWEKVSPAVNASSNKVFHGALDDIKPVRPLSIPDNPRLILTPAVLDRRALNMIDQAA